MASKPEVLPVNVGGEDVPGRVAVTVGWEAFHNAMGIQSREDLSEWILNQGFRRPCWRAQFSGRVQERIWNAVNARDARGAAFDSFKCPYCDAGMS